MHAVLTNIRLDDTCLPFSACRTVFVHHIQIKCVALRLIHGDSVNHIARAQTQRVCGQRRTEVGSGGHKKPEIKKKEPTKKTRKLVLHTWSGLSGCAIPSTARDTDGAGLRLLSMSRVASFSSRLRCWLLLRRQPRSTASRQTPVD